MLRTHALSNPSQQDVFHTGPPPLRPSTPPPPEPSLGPPPSRIQQPIQITRGITSKDYYDDAEDMLRSSFSNPLDYTSDRLEFFPPIRVPDALTIADAYANLPIGPYGGIRARAVEAERFPYLTVSLDQESDFDPQVDLRFKKGVRIDKTHWPHLYGAFRNYENALADSRFLIRSDSETNQQGILAMLEGDIINFLFSTKNDQPIFFDYLPRWLRNMYWIHEHKSNFMSRDSLVNLVGSAARSRKGILEAAGIPFANDPIYNRFTASDSRAGRGTKQVTLPFAGSIADHVIGELCNAEDGNAIKGIAIIYVEEKRLNPGTLRDLIYYLAHYNSATASLGHTRGNEENIPLSETFFPQEAGKI
ncbi:uncharacterized protein I206_102493 [Kwoniella pini CBS 10737]|uniref:Uncharacterized protein n=1 Tax=Kwoniella pini CBS 10737 TaxID=1296096 RepID=A0A1B9I5I8_9TREE|nr:uncharacterized protein I206_02844 [Kwoniella pini CBS 10737]OCF50788.1 hypothetical protein I206_02844 [Kwoniella pini CBS 10737]